MRPGACRRCQDDRMCLTSGDRGKAIMDLRKAALLLLHRLRLHKVAAVTRRLQGVVFSAHRVQPARQGAFQPNLSLTITPEFLELAIVQARAAGFDILSLDDAHGRLLDGADGGGQRRPFACFTFDDGYRDNWDWAFPVLKRHRVPHTIYVPLAFAEGTGVLWWELLERVIAANDSIEAEGISRLTSKTVDEKRRAFTQLASLVYDLPPPAGHGFATSLAARYGIDSNAVCRELMLGWDELVDFSKEALLTIGGHTVNHFRLAKLPADESAREIERGLLGLQERLGRMPRHFSYPFGDFNSADSREFALAGSTGLKTAVTTNSGVIHGGNRQLLTSLPRLSLNRVYGDLRCLDVLMTGAPAALFRR